MDLIKEWKKEEKAPFKGWDFSHLNERMIEDKLPWDYIATAKKLVRKSKSVLDMGTGGGEIFSKLAPFPKHAVATEGYRPNIPVARKRLKPLGVKVIDFENASVKKLPFAAGEFDLVLNRHDAFDVKEVYRILRKGGVFLMQQVGKSNLDDLARAFGKKTKYAIPPFGQIKKDLKKTGFNVKIFREFRGKTKFTDVGAVVYFLKAIPWAVPGFSVNKNLKQLEKLQRTLEREGELRFSHVRYLILARK